MSRCFAIDALTKEASACVKSFLQDNQPDQPVDWSCLLSVDPKEIRLHVIICSKDTGRVLDTRCIYL